MIKANNRGGFEVVIEHLRNNPNSRVSAGRTFLFGGSPTLDELAPGIFAGELSGIAARETPLNCRKRPLLPATRTRSDR